MSKPTDDFLSLMCGIAALCAGEAAGAETVSPDAAALQFEEVVVTATKKEHTESVQQVPLAVTAFGAEQLQSLAFQNLTSLSYTMPNVQMDAIGTTAATANFSIRGLGINSSIPSIDPTVGVFVDGVYMGINAGVLFDHFDLDGIEVLRGPQGVLFGRNVTGGAVLVRTKAPSDTFGATARVAIESGPNLITDGSITGPLVAGVLDGKLAVYRDDDAGWFKNLYDGSRFGAQRETIARPALRWTPSDALDFTLRYEHGQTDGDGPPAQNHALYSRSSFNFSIDQGGHADSKWDQVLLETNWKVGFGNGKITNIVGWRKYDSWSTGDIDSTSFDLPGTPTFAAEFKTRQNQRSEELRYAGTFGPAELTTGLYYFQQNLLYVEQRTLDSLLLGRPPPAFPFKISGGGDGDFSTAGAFAATDWSLTDTWKLNLGVRYTHESKKAKVATNGPGNASVAAGTIVPNFADRHSWSDVSPRVGFQWLPAHNSQIYAFWARGFRSGGYNFRSTDPSVPPGPFDAETQSSFEIGLKQDFAGGRARVNFAAFHNKISNIQREINLPSATAGVTQEILNVGDATIQGGELEGIFRASSHLTLSVEVGYTDGKYDKITHDLDRDFYARVDPRGIIDGGDYALQLPRLSPWTYGTSAMWDIPAGSFGVVSTRLSFNHRDKAYYTDNNQGFLNSINRLDANLTWIPSRGPFRLAIYGTNLLNEVTFGGDTVLPNVRIFGGGGPIQPTFSPLNKGRVVGAELRVSF